ncbi:MAG: FHA domain-containing protein [Bradymonadia bacterium]
MSDQNRKTLRSFYCRDYLWDLFEVMTRDLGCSVDYLINESMRHYARSRNYSLTSAAEAVSNEAPRSREPGNAQRRPPPLPHGSPQSGRRPKEAVRPSMYLLFNGQRYRLDKDRFIIGRGSQVTDLTIRDGNISRKHCAIIYRGGNYFIKDLDSTNGVEYNGKRVERKRIEEGDTFYLCDYELRFTFR